MKYSAVDNKLRDDTYFIGYFQGDVLLLMRNALFPWFVIVPDTSEHELYLLGEQQQSKIMNQVSLVSKFLNDNFIVDKLNVASIGNIVSQLHIHIVGRNHADVCWPGVVWGDGQFKAYAADEVQNIKNQLKKTFKSALELSAD